MRKSIYADGNKGEEGRDRGRENENKGSRTRKTKITDRRGEGRESWREGRVR